jgi:hypothetical protein
MYQTDLIILLRMFSGRKKAAKVSKSVPTYLDTSYKPTKHGIATEVK